MIITGVLNGSNYNRDSQFQELVSELATAGVKKGYSTECEVQENILKAGKCFVEITRDSITPNEVFKVPVSITADEVIDTSGTGYVIIKGDDTKINDGSLNADDGSAIFTVEVVASLPTKNFLELASLSSGTITDTRTYAVISDNAKSELTKADVGLGNVDNTSDADKPLSTATQIALDGKQGSSIDYELSRDAVAGRIMQLLDDGRVEDVVLSETPFNASAEITSADFDHNTANRIVRGYRSNNGYGYTAVYSAVGLNVTKIGTGSLFAQLPSGKPIHTSMDKINTDKFIVVFSKDDASDILYAVICSIDVSNNVTYGTLKYIGVVPDSTQTTVLYDENLADSGIIKCVSGTSSYIFPFSVSGSTITTGSNISSTSDFCSISYISQGKFLVVYSEDNGNANAVVMTLSGTSLTKGQDNFFKVGRVGNLSSSYKDGKVVILYHDIDGDDDMKSIVGDLLADVITFGAEENFSDAIDTNHANETAFYRKPGLFGVARFYNKMCNFEISGTSIIKDVINPSVSSIFDRSIDLKTDPFNEDRFVIGTSYVNRGYTKLCNAPTANNLDSTKILGILGADGTAGDFRPVNILGNVSNVNSGLDLLTDYYVNKAGELTTSSSSPNVKIGKAIKSTALALYPFT